MATPSQNSVSADRSTDPPSQVLTQANGTIQQEEVKQVRYVAARPTVQHKSSNTTTDHYRSKCMRAELNRRLSMHRSARSRMTISITLLRLVDSTSSRSSSFTARNSLGRQAESKALLAFLMTTRRHRQCQTSRRHFTAGSRPRRMSSCSTINQASRGRPFSTTSTRA